MNTDQDINIIVTMPQGNWVCKVHLTKYENGQNRINLTDVVPNGPIATASICVQEETLASDEVAIKDWSENEGMLKSLIEQDIVSEPVRYIQTEYVMIPICKLQI